MSRLLITGGKGFLGQALTKEFTEHSDRFTSVDTFRSSEYDLRDKEAVQQLLADKKPEIIVHLAATVGGIGANKKHPGLFFYENLMMGVHLIEESRLFGVKKFVQAGTICSYPKFTPVPFKEEELWNGYPEETNAPYGIAKKALMVQLQAYRQEYGFNGVTVLPVNLYGPRDNFELESSHVIPAMLRKFHTAKEEGVPVVHLWGDGSPSREFLYVDDAARAIRLATEKYESSEPVNLGSGQEITMKKLASVIQRTVGYQGEVNWDVSKPNGQPRRCLDTSRAENEFGFKANVTLPMGLEMTYEWFVENFSVIRDGEQAGERAST
ncbi:MAG: GDP-L-fucose synthase [Bdellovibrionota bacterium]